ncbi:MAG: HlyD family efflux transporter periplasmic adaptor subunit [Ahrensia sp.]|nr:HlyD family efflux transporter periplasmic adaptor subunit [Ahrensia sp.]
MASTAPEPKLPGLRDDLTIERGAPDVGGWMITDPVRQAYFRISQSIFEVMAIWRAGTKLELSVAYEERFAKPLPDERLEAVAKFLIANELTREPKDGGWRHYAGIAKSREKSILSKGLHSYLFFRIPLVRPQKFLDIAWPFVSWMFTRSFVITSAVLGLLALWLVSRQWDVFLTTFSSFLTWEGAFTYGVVLALVKVIHEFGHAFMARKYGAHVSTLGAAFIVLFPILYTDTTSAWRLERRKRLMIDAAGIFAELVLAVVATLLWVFLPDGMMRSLAFVVATISWVLSLAVNLNPLMRFDGYYLLSDGSGIENLQGRGFALARWRLREFLFGFGEPAPENMAASTQRLVIAHAYATWVYRFFLFLGIALVVYHMFFKIAGIALFAVEIAWFIVLPIWRELKEWRARAAKFNLNWATLRSAALLIGLLGILFVPWQSRVAAPAVLSAENVEQIFPRGAGQIVEFNLVENKPVRRGEVLATLQDVTVEAQLSRVDQEINLLKLRLARTSADAQDLSFRSVLESELQSKIQEFAALQNRIGDLVVTASMDGVLSNTITNLKVGDYLSGARPIGIISNRNAGTIKAFVASEAIGRLSPGATATFFAEELEQKPIELVLTDLAPAVENDAAMRTQLDIFGGEIATKQDAEKGTPVPAVPHYQANFKPLETFSSPNFEMRGTVHIKATTETLARRIVRRIAGVLIRESGF